MISVLEALKIFKEYRPAGYVIGGRIVDGFGFVFESTECYIDDSIVIVGFDGKINHLVAFPPSPSEEYQTFRKSPNRRIPVKEFKPAGRVLFSYHYESCWCRDPSQIDGTGFELYYDGSLYLTEYKSGLPFAVKYEKVCKCTEAVKSLKSLFAELKDEIATIPEDIIGHGCDGRNDFYKFANKKIQVYLDWHPVLSKLYGAALAFVQKEYPEISEYSETL